MRKLSNSELKRISVDEYKVAKKNTPYFSTDAGWAKSYQTDEYMVRFEPGGCGYTLTFKREIPTNSAFIWTSGSDWKKAD